MTHLHMEFVISAYLIFALALLWDFLAPHFSYKKTLRNIRLRARRNKANSRDLAQ
ncbi:MAG: heme exporter protein CcmD [Methylococcales bacterium]